MKILLLGLLLVILALFALQLRAAQQGPQIGAQAPDFNLPDQQGMLRKLSEFRGKWVVLYFYPKDETPGCTKEACAFRDDWQHLVSLNVQVIGISVEDPASHAQFVSKHKLPFLLLSDVNAAVVEQYGAVLDLWFTKIAKRHTYVISPEGKVAKAYLSVDPGGHSREVIEFIKNNK